MPTIRTETETVIKKVLPYLERRGYDVTSDLDFETAIKMTDRYNKGYVDILVTCGKTRPIFLIEAKKISKRLTNKDRDQAISYATSKSISVPFVIITNGTEIRSYNTFNKEPIRWNGQLSEKIPTKSQLKHVISALRSDKSKTSIILSGDKSLPFRPGLALKQLNGLFARCHGVIRKIEKNEEHAFSDFSKFLFLKLLEEKADIADGFSLPYSYLFHELAEKPSSESDQVKDAILSMIEEIVRRTTYGDVLEEPIYLRNPRTFHYIVKQLANVSFYDSSLDSKGAAFEYFVRATLKGKKLGQYFTPRPLVQIMSELVGREKIIQSILAGSTLKVLDPACGTGGFIVFLMQDSLKQLEQRLKGRKITKSAFDKLSKSIMKDTFFGSDANEGVACSAKMNMIIAGDGHSNIQPEDSLSLSSKNWNYSSADCDLIMTNPPFGTSETDSLTSRDMSQYPIRSSKGQHLFLQKMVLATKPGGEICTVIDEGVLNTETAAELREWLLKHCKVLCVLRLPPETFKPNKINVRSSVLFLQRHEEEDVDLEKDYLVTFCSVDNLGYFGSGENIRNFNFNKLLKEIGNKVLSQTNRKRKGYHWTAFEVKSQKIFSDSLKRFDFKYWEPVVINKINKLKKYGSPLLKDLNRITTSRGKSPSADSYVDKRDGYAIVIKAGSSISKYGKLMINDSDYIEKSLYDEYLEKSKELGENINLVFQGDVLLASTGDGTLGKCCVFDIDKPAIADGHVTVIRVNSKEILPQYLCDYLRCGFGAKQIERLYTGSTGLIELTPNDVASLVIELLDSIKHQQKISNTLRKKELSYNSTIESAEKALASARLEFAET